MVEIKDIVKSIKKELKDAERYAMLALKVKDTDRELAQGYADLARKELGDSDWLHNQAVRLIRAKRASGVEPPAAMQAVWDYEHEQTIEQTADVRRIIEEVSR